MPFQYLTLIIGEREEGEEEQEEEEDCEGLYGPDEEESECEEGVSTSHCSPSPSPVVGFAELPQPHMNNSSNHSLKNKHPLASQSSRNNKNHLSVQNQKNHKSRSTTNTATSSDTLLLNSSSLPVATIPSAKKHYYWVDHSDEDNSNNSDAGCGVDGAKYQQDPAGEEDLVEDWEALDSSSSFSLTTEKEDKRSNRKDDPNSTIQTVPLGRSAAGGGGIVHDDANNNSSSSSRNSQTNTTQARPAAPSAAAAGNAGCAAPASVAQTTSLDVPRSEEEEEDGGTGDGGLCSVDGNAWSAAAAAAASPPSLPPSTWCGWDGIRFPMFYHVDQQTPRTARTTTNQPCSRDMDDSETRGSDKTREDRLHHSDAMATVTAAGSSLPTPATQQKRCWGSTRKMACDKGEERRWGIPTPIGCAAQQYSEMISNCVQFQMLGKEQARETGGGEMTADKTVEQKVEVEAKASPTRDSGCRSSEGRREGDGVGSGLGYRGAEKVQQGEPRASTPSREAGELRYQGRVVDGHDLERGEMETNSSWMRDNLEAGNNNNNNNNGVGGDDDDDDGMVVRLPTGCRLSHLQILVYFWKFMAYVDRERDNILTAAAEEEAAAAEEEEEEIEGGTSWSQTKPQVERLSSSSSLLSPVPPPWGSREPPLPFTCPSSCSSSWLPIQSSHGPFFFSSSDRERQRGHRPRPSVVSWTRRPRQQRAYQQQWWWCFPDGQIPSTTRSPLYRVQRPSEEGGDAEDMNAEGHIDKIDSSSSSPSSSDVDNDKENHSRPLRLWADQIRRGRARIAALGSEVDPVRMPMLGPEDRTEAVIRAQNVQPRLFTSTTTPAGDSAAEAEALRLERQEAALGEDILPYNIWFQARDPAVVLFVEHVLIHSYVHLSLSPRCVAAAAAAAQQEEKEKTTAALFTEDGSFGDTTVDGVGGGNNNNNNNNNTNNNNNNNNNNSCSKQTCSCSSPPVVTPSPRQLRHAALIPPLPWHWHRVEAAIRFDREGAMGVKGVVPLVVHSRDQFVFLSELLECAAFTECYLLRSTLAQYMTCWMMHSDESVLAATLSLPYAVVRHMPWWQYGVSVAEDGYVRPEEMERKDPMSDHNKDSNDDDDDVYDHDYDDEVASDQTAERNVPLKDEREGGRESVSPHYRQRCLVYHWQDAVDQHKTTMIPTATTTDQPVLPQQKKLLELDWPIRFSRVSKREFETWERDHVVKGTAFMYQQRELAYRLWTRITARQKRRRHDRGYGLHSPTGATGGGTSRGGGKTPQKTTSSPSKGSASRTKEAAAEVSQGDDGSDDDDDDDDDEADQQRFKALPAAAVHFVQLTHSILSSLSLADRHELIEEFYAEQQRTMPPTPQNQRTTTFANAAAAASSALLWPHSAAPPQRGL